MKLLQLLKLRQSRQAAVVLQSQTPPPKDWHILFQNLRYLGERTYPGGSWSARTELGTDANGKRHFLDLVILADSRGPTHGQVVFYQWLIHHPDELFDSIRHRVIPAWEIKTGERFPSNWRSELVLHSLYIPRYGDKQRRWTVIFKLKRLAGKRMVVEMHNGIAINVAFEYLGTFQHRQLDSALSKASSSGRRSRNPLPPGLSGLAN